MSCLFVKFVLGTSKFLQRGIDLSRITVSACRTTSWSSIFVNRMLQPGVAAESSHEDENRRTENNVNKQKLILGTAAAFFGLFGSDEKEDDKIPDLIMAIKRSILLIQREDFKKAEQMLHIALRQAQTLQHYEAITYIYDIMANLAFDVGDYQKAEKLFVSVMQRLISTGTPKDDMKIIHISLKMAKIYQMTGDIQKAEDGFDFCFKSLQKRIDSHKEDEDVILLWAMTLDWYARLLFEQSRHTEALNSFLKAYELCVRINGREHEQTVVLLNDLGTISSLRGDDDEAIDYLSEAVEIGKKLPDMVDLGSIHVNLGNVYMKKGLYEAAKKSCQEGWKLSKNRNNEESLTEASNCLNEIKRLLS
ncbi:tetratricopeptide repeat protein 19 homolog, mitochondrial [Cephus cinctus]|uniref:Tetratricopeptide repeat protein 19 homolog, mitochondrial n=1 Tax=Cephus cinctus TaxID=211228 RepID=A0AAJ7FR48_CEPCN|nr:tetratricopeptide repeat protein 19 homolog, mitochondrial [Cephus cinctus]